MSSETSQSKRLRIAIICIADFEAPAEKIVLGFAQELARRGHRVLIGIQGQEDSILGELPEGLPEGVDSFQYRFRGPRLRHQDVEAARDFKPDVVHVYSPRVPVVKAVQQMYGEDFPMVLNFEDDEWGLAVISGDSTAQTVKRAVGRTVSPLYPPAWPYVTDGTFDWCSTNVDVMHAITPELAREVEKRLGRDCEVLPPVHPSLDNKERQVTQPELPEWAQNRPLVVFTGAVFGPQLEDFELLLDAVGILYGKGIEPVLVHSGMVAPRFDLAASARRAGIAEHGFLGLGYLSSSDMWGLLDMATVLVQPGKRSEFNRLRLPSKLQSYLGSGSPTITFAYGAGELLEDRGEVLKTYGEEPEELADCIAELLENLTLQRTLSENGPSAAGRLFGAKRNTDTLEGIYLEAIDKSGSRTG